MIETKSIMVNSQGFILGLLIIFSSLALSILFPLIAPLLGIVLLASGIYAYKYNANDTTRTIAIATIVSGLLCLIIAALIAFFLVTNTTTTASIENYPGQIP